jgi:transcription-repair coupling factor (superfamily II helicase)
MPTAIYKMNFTEIVSKLERALYGHGQASGEGARVAGERGMRVDLDAASSTHAALLLSCLLSKAGSQERAKSGSPFFWIAPDKASAEARARELELLSGRPVHLFPAWSELLFMPLIPSRDLVSQRISALHAAMNSERALIVTWAEALLEPLAPPDILASAVETISTGDEIGRDILADWLVDAGYEPCRVVTRVGEFAVRGGIVDLFSPGWDLPVRLDFLGDEVETIRSFDPDTQRSRGRLDRVRLLPMTDFILSAKSADEAIGRLIEEAGSLGLSASAVTETMQLIKERRTYEMHLALLPLIYSPAARLSDYMEGSVAVVMERPGEILRNLEEASKAAETSWRQELERERIFAGFDRYILPLSDLKAGLGPRRKILVWAGDIYREAGIDAIVHEDPDMEFRLPVESCRVPSLRLSFKRGRELFAPVVELLQQWSAEDGGQVVLLASDREQERRISSLLAHYGIEPETYRPGDGRGLCRLAIRESG